MSNPAIVLMTDPSRCSLGDVHYLLQALLELQQMGEHAAPLAFCDHPAAAKGFIEAYAHAYPRLVLQDDAIPTPDHLQSLIANSQIGALGQPPERAPFAGPTSFGAPSRAAEQSGSNGFPIVVLTLGSSQALIDAMKQSPAMKDSIRLIDIAPDGTDSQPVSVAEAVASGGLDGDGEAEGLGVARPELDEVASASIRASGDLAFDRDPLDLDGVETADAPSRERPDDDGGEPEAAAPAPAPAAEPAPAAAAAPAVVELPAAEQASPTAGPVSEQAGAVETIRPADPVPASVEPTAEPAEAQGEGAADGGGNGAGPPKDDAGEGAGEDDEHTARVGSTTTTTSTTRRSAV